MQTKRSELIVGLVIIIAILVVVIGKVLITGNQTKSEMYELTTIFPEIGGLEVGNAVFVNGVRAGKVADIALRQNEVAVRLLINRAVTLKKDARIEIVERGMMGEREIKIDPGSSDEVMDITESIHGCYNVGFNETVSEIGKTIQNINALSGSLVKIVGDKQEIENFKTMLLNFNLLITNLNRILEKNKDIQIEFDRINNILTNLDSLISKNDDKVDRIITFADNKLETMNEMIIQLQTLLEIFQKEDTSFSRFTDDDSLYNKLDASLDKFDALITDIKENPKKYFSLF
ncbi:MAG TPA: MCE family protein [Candidatus Cloacimonetes bacterium]|nr:MCE family protein [Candidatus Cloacimonadota bacterium]HEX38225.1 MCE family protein [Candidatus Cloacimonadota bacterium]